ncbi:hypothetical protein GSI_14263 [Ganoderma sinense ZZ0214-1]|uniref:Uncharacterized protein n=1 Tax=Ganoderma sinense ZZ0214-1 TaxID=1077348 RepID=A0A2G8RT37_9APHY|nr:hypothetical protein GSI_14263 [Ganoderma sinense ZZ0214-1]
MLYIFGEEDAEVCELSACTVVDSDSQSETSSSADEHHSRASSANPPSRWATYPDTYFLWSRLPVWTGRVLPTIGGEASRPRASVSGTYTAKRGALWQSIPSSLPHQLATGAFIPPWRALGGFSEAWLSMHPVSSSLLPPPPPMTTPPPLPEVGAPPWPSRSPLSVSHGREDGSESSDMEEESDTDDMDLSD